MKLSLILWIKNKTLPSMRDFDASPKTQADPTALVDVKKSYC